MELHFVKLVHIDEDSATTVLGRQYSDLCNNIRLSFAFCLFFFFLGHQTRLLWVILVTFAYSVKISGFYKVSFKQDEKRTVSLPTT